jgi:hypothetical protein
MSTLFVEVNLTHTVFDICIAIAASQKVGAETPKLRCKVSVQNNPGRPDWANLRPLVDCLHWEVFWKLQM